MPKRCQFENCIKQAQGKTNFVYLRYLILRQLKTIILIRFPEITT